MKEHVAELEVELGYPEYESVYLKSEVDHFIAELTAMIWKCKGSHTSTKGNGCTHADILKLLNKGE